MALTLPDLASSPILLQWVTFLFAAWFVVIEACKKTPQLSGKPAATAHSIVAMVPVFYLAVQGVRIWFFDQEFVAAFQEDKMYGSYQPVQALAIVYLAHQVWDLASCAATHDLRSLPMLVHHGLSGWLAYNGLTSGPPGLTHGGFVMYYGAFFFGVSEVSSIPLLAMDVFKKNKELGRQFDYIFQRCRITFAALFIVIRLLYWPYVSYDFWTNMWQCDAKLLLKIIWLSSNMGLTLLQFFWGKTVVVGVAEVVLGKPRMAGMDGDGKHMHGDGKPKQL